MPAEQLKIVRIVTALEQQLNIGNLSVNHRQKLQQQIGLLRTKYPACFSTPSPHD
jgi:hypothetical protein